MLARPSVGIILLLCAMSGCVSSEHGLALPDDEKVVFDPALLGDWTYVDPSGGSQATMLRVERLGDEGTKTYTLTWSADGSVAPGQGPQQAKGSLVVIGDSRYLDLASIDKKDGDRHMFFKLKRQNTSLTLQSINPNYLSTHPKSLAHRFDEGGSGRISIQIPVLTATTPELRRFLEAHQADPELWSEELSYKFQRR